MKFKIPNILVYAALIFSLTLTDSAALAQNGDSYGSNNASVRSVPDSVTTRMKQQKEFLYANDPAYWQQEKSQDESAIANMLDKIARSSLLKWVLYLFLSFVVVFAIYQVMVVNDFFIFSKPRKKKSVGIDGEELFSAESLEEKITEAISKGEYRLAIRFMYLQTLKILEEKKLIQLSAGSTNRDYIFQMRQHHSGGEFSRLTRIYEFVWYGEFQPSEHQFGLIHNHFKDFNGGD